MANGSMPKEGVMLHETPVHTPGNNQARKGEEMTTAHIECIHRESFQAPRASLEAMEEKLAAAHTTP